MRDLSSDLASWAATPSRLVPLVDLYEIEVGDDETVYLVAGDPAGSGSISYAPPGESAREYVAAAIVRDAAAQNLEGELPSINVSVGNLDGVAGGYIERGDLDGRRVRIRHLLLASIRDGSADPEDAIVEEFTIKECAYDRRSATIALGPPNFFKRRAFSNLYYQRHRCSNRWGDRFNDPSFCGYPSTNWVADTGANFRPQITSDARVALRFGWRVVNGTKLTVCDSDTSIPEALYLATTGQNIDWIPGSLAAPFMFKELTTDFDCWSEFRIRTSRPGMLVGLLAQPSGAGQDSWILWARGLDEGGESVIRARVSVAGNLSSPPAIASDDRFLRLSRIGANWSAYSSEDGEAWTLRGEYELPIDLDARIGVLLSASNNATGLIAVALPYVRFFSGGLLTCGKTFEECEARGNVHRFRAFRTMPRR